GLVACRAHSVRSGYLSYFFFQAEDGIRDRNVTGVQTCALPICCLVTRLAVARILRPGSALVVTVRAGAIPRSGAVLRSCGGLGRLSAQAREVRVVRRELGAAVARRLAVVLPGPAVLGLHPHHGDDDRVADGG